MLAAYTYSSGLRAPALIAFVKDTLIYIVIAVAIIYIPIKLGGFDDIFAKAGDAYAQINPATDKPRGSLVPATPVSWGYATLALGSALALFMYPHSITATLSSESREVIRRNTTILPLYSLMLGLLALLGFMAIAAGMQGGERPAGDPAAVRDDVPRLVRGCGLRGDRHRRAGPGGDHVDRGGEPLHPQHLQGLHQAGRDARAGDQGLQAGSLLVKVGALAFVLTMDKTVAINFQLLGGIWILQTFPALVGGLFTRWFHRWALLAGWAVGMIYGTIAAYGVATPDAEALRRLVGGDPRHR